MQRESVMNQTERRKKLRVEERTHHNCVRNSVILGGRRIECRSRTHSLGIWNRAVRERNTF